MVNVSVYVAVSIACVVALLLITVLVIYCIKRHKDKEVSRQVQEERARRERHRRQLLRATIVRPPPYEPNRREAVPYGREPLPFSPPPAYKEMATPLPPRETQTVGIGGSYPPPLYEPIPTVSRNVAPAPTVYNNSSNYMTSSYTVANPNVGNNSSSSNNSTINTNARQLDNSYSSRVPPAQPHMVRTVSPAATRTVVVASSLPSSNFSSLATDRRPPSRTPRLIDAADARNNYYANAEHRIGLALAGNNSTSAQRLNAANERHRYENSAGNPRDNSGESGYSQSYARTYHAGFTGHTAAYNPTQNQNNPYAAEVANSQIYYSSSRSQSANAHSSNTIEDLSLI